MTDLTHLTRHWPLVARPRPAGLPLSDRIQEVRDLVQRGRAGDSGAGQAEVAAAYNRAALIASDCGLHNLATDLCWQHVARYPDWPLDAATARLALEPVVNLARLAIRARDGDGAHRLLDSLYDGVTRRVDIAIDGRTLRLSRLTATDDDHRTVREWLWTVLLAEGTRALATAGRWTDALRLAEQHRGVGTRLLDGRQVAVLAHCTSGGTATALTILADSRPAEPWEDAVAACLKVLCETAAGSRSKAATAAMVDQYLDLVVPGNLAVFGARLGLAVVDLAADDQAVASRVARHIVCTATSGADGYAARDVLLYGGPLLAPGEREALTPVVTAAGLDQSRTADVRTAAGLAEALLLNE
ncbi:hypothetical protein [Polymorphospora sp. NPDC050346]|uniref:hypothetical protein n=1 Tax=Polymorphospora sp. NPDC050346 TaxID=3155780 RepID=UPI00340D73F1